MAQVYSIFRFKITIRTTHDLIILWNYASNPIMATSITHAYIDSEYMEPSRHRLANFTQPTNCVYEKREREKKPAFVYQRLDIYMNFVFLLLFFLRCLCVQII